MKKDKNRFAGISALLCTINLTWADRFRIGTAMPRIRPLLLLSLGLLFWSVAAIAQLPTLGSYPSANVTAGGNTTVTPSAAPSNTVHATAIANPGFTGVLTVNPANGVVGVTDAKQAGTYMVTVTAFNSGGNTATATFALTVTNPVCSAGGFTGGTDLAVNSVQTSLAVGDFNGDGNQDLAIAEYSNAGTVAIRLGDGSGGFTGITSVAVGNFPTSVAVGDFNGDGKLDFAAANKNSDNVSIRLGNGSGLFTSNTDVVVGDEPEFVAVGDFNGDGKQDLVVANTISDNVSIVLGDGVGGFGSASNMATGDLPRSIAIDDFNGDGKQDLAVVNGNSRNVSIHLGNGMGGFTNNGTVSVGIQPYSVAAGDFNSDGDQDLLVANSVSDNVSVLLGNGSGGFTSGTNVAVGDEPRSVAVGDFNGDGKQDFAAGNRIFAGIVAIWLGDGTGGFTNGTNMAVSPYPSFLAVGDFNSDGKQDLAMASLVPNSALSTYLAVANDINLRGNGVDITDGDNAPATSDHTDFGATTGVPITRTFTIHNTGMEALNLATGAITISGSDASLFSVSNIALPAAISGPSGSITFDVTYTPSASGVHTATVNIASDDCDEDSYDFAIRGELTCTTPTFTNCPSTQVSLNTAPNTCTATATYNVAANGTPAPTLTYTFAGATTGSSNGTGTGSTFNKGTTIVTLSATNTCSTSTCQFNVTVTDNVPPTITCPSNATVAANASCQGTVGVHILTSKSDNCATTINEMQSPSAGMVLSGHNAAQTVTLTANDGNGNTTACTLTVTLNDGTPPTITCPPNATVTANASCQNTIGAYSAVSVADNCNPSPVVTQSPASSTILTGHNSAQTVKLTANDGNGNTTTCTLTVTLNDITPPTITCPPNRTVNADAGQCSSVQTYTVTASDNCVYTLTRTNGLPSGSAFPFGLNMINFQVTDAGGNSTVCSFSITVIDNQPPTISCPNSSTTTSTPGLCGAAVNYSVSGSDNCSGWSLLRTSGLQSGALFPVGTSTVTWRNTDTGGNSTTCAFTVTVTDGQLPGITCPANITANAATGSCAATVNYTTPTFSDNCAGTSAMHVSGGTSGSSFNKGVNTIEWKATDAANNTRTCSFTITVNDNQLPSITCPANITANTATGSCAATVNFNNATATDNCTPPPTVIQSSGAASGSSFPKGLHTISFKATDGVGLTMTCTFRITVVDNVLPTITCPGNIMKNTDNNLCTAVTSYAVTGADNCSSVSVSRASGLASGSAFPRGVNTVIWRATDLAGNSTLCSFTVTVSDAQLPGITCPTSISTNTTTGQCSKVVNYTTPTYSDNCAGGSISLFGGLASGSVFPVGTSTVTWRAIDNAANSNTCAFTVTVMDNELPVITCPPAATVSGSGSPCGYPASQLSTPAATDNCAVTSLASNAPTTLPAGANTITWTAGDAEGNQKTCAYVVTVNCGTAGMMNDEIRMMNDAERESASFLTVPSGQALITHNSSLITHHLSLFPNPASDFVVVTLSNQQINNKSNQQFSGSNQQINSGSNQQPSASNQQINNTSNQQLIIHDARGRVVWQQKVPAEAQQLKLDLSDAKFADGVYWVVLRSEAGTRSEKLILSRL